VLPDPLALRSAATALAASADDVRVQEALLSAVLAKVRWAAPLVDDIRRQLAQARADGLSGCLGLVGGAAHLRATAAAIEDLRAATGRLHGAAVTDLQAALAISADGSGADLLRRQAAALPGPQDPSWAARSGVASVAPPELVLIRPDPVVPSPPGFVGVDLPAAGGVGGAGRATARSASSACAGGSSRTAGLDMWLLDAYGLAGSRSAAWLAGLVGPGSALARASDGWASAARTSGLLVDLLTAADSGQSLLTDPRLPLALDALEALRTGPQAVHLVLDRLPPVDVAWLADVVPGLVGAPGVSPSPEGAPWWQPSNLDWVDALNSLWQLPLQLTERLQDRLVGLVRLARALRSAARPLSGLARTRLRLASLQTMTMARDVQVPAATAAWLAARLRVPSWLRSLTTTPIVDAPVLRHLSRLGVLGTALSLFLDLRSGDGVPMAIAKAAAGIGAVVLVDVLLGGIVTGLVVVGAPVWVTLLAGTALLAVSAVAAMAAVAVVARFGPGLVRLAGRAAGGLRSGSVWAARAAGRATGAGVSRLARAGAALAGTGRRLGQSGQGQLTRAVGAGREGAGRISAAAGSRLRQLARASRRSLADLRRSAGVLAPR